MTTTRLDGVFPFDEKLSSLIPHERTEEFGAVGYSFGSNLAREALFSYTILRDRGEETEPRETVSLIGRLVAAAQFADPKIV